MRLPNAEKAFVDRRKLSDYLLSPSHPVGRYKARFFETLGFGLEHSAEFAAAIALLAESGEAEMVSGSDYGRKYLISGTLTGPGGRSATVVSVWIVRAGDDIPRLVTVYPRQP